MNRSLSLAVLLAALAPLSFADPEPEGPNYDAIVKDHEHATGLLETFSKVDEKTQVTTHLALVPKDLLGKDCLFAISMSRGPWTGILWNELTVRWEVRGTSLLLVEPATAFRAAEGTPLASSVARTHVERIVATTPILARSGDGGALFDATALFGHQDLAELAEGLGEPNPELARIDSMKTFPDNCEIAADQAFRQGARATPVRVHYSLRRVPETSYRARAADERIGYFTVVARDYAKSPDAKSVFSRLVTRWHLEKADDTLELSPPKQPIVWYIEKTVPFRYRRYIREGILAWNKAFEQIGFVDAVVVRQQVEGGDFDNLDPEDARYNFFRWGTANVGYAFGPSRSNPATGEILNAAVYFDDSVLRYNLGSYRTLSTAHHLRAADPKLAGFLDTNPRWRAVSGFDEPVGSRAPAAPRLPRHHGRCCAYGQGKMHQLAMATLRLGKEGAGELPETFIGQTMVEYVMHEIGHTLGLRHNFKASAWHKLADLTGKNEVKAISASVMDYNALVFPIAEGEAKNYQMREIGPYDAWAIEYGYKPLDEGEEAKGLAEIAAKSSQPGLDYGTDEDSSSIDPDPMIRQWDMGDDHFAFARRAFAHVEKLRPTLVERAVAAGESYASARRAFLTLLHEYSFAVNLTAQYVGGASLNRDHRGTPGARAPIVPIPVERQREALALLGETVFSAKAFDVPPELLAQLAAGRWDHEESDQFDDELFFDLPAVVARIQRRTLFQLFNPYTQKRVAGLPLVTAKGAASLPLSELYATVAASAWAELDTAGPVAIPLTRRTLQRSHLDLMILLAIEDLDLPPDARTLAWNTLSDLTAKIGRRVADASEPVVVAHLRETLARATKAIDASYQHR